ncbi:MAG TPA: TolC family protein, partial [Polyangiaceae bacterium]|nr:TolC family protein [Polyangiaceae bacterium]
MTKRRLPWILVLSGFAPQALAQPAPAPAAPRAPVTAAAPQPAAAGAPPSEPNLPNIDDPMLVPAPPAQHVLRTWRESLTLVRQNSSTLRTSAARTAEAEGLARQALAGALPTLTGNAALTHHLLRGEGITSFSPLETGSIPDPATTWNAGLNLRVPVFAPKVWYDHGTAKDSIEATRLSSKELERQVLASVANSIVSVVTAERLAEVSRVSLKSALSTLDLNKRREALGASSALDVLRAEQEVQLARGQVVSSDEGLLRAREALGLALGTSESWSVTPDIKIDQLADDAKTSCRAQTNVADRPDVRAQAANVAIAERRVKGVDWSFWPTVDATS